MHLNDGIFRDGLRLNLRDSFDGVAAVLVGSVLRVDGHGVHFCEDFAFALHLLLLVKEWSLSIMISCLGVPARTFELFARSGTRTYCILFLIQKEQS